MKVIKPFGPKDLRLVDAPIPEPNPGFVRVKVRASGICGSDKWIWSVTEPTDVVAGHEVAGEIDKLGEGVTSFAVGDRVMINNVGGCGVCPACRAGEFVFCPSWDGSRDVNNGLGEYLVAPARNCMKLLPGLDFIDGALIPDNWGTPYSNIKCGQVGIGKDVLVNGCGPIGQAAVSLCKMLGAYVIAVDPVEYRRQMALKNGADRAFSPEELPDAARKVSDGLGVHTVLECSGNGNAYPNCLNSLRIGGRLIAVGEHANFSVCSSDLIRRSLGIAASWYSTMQSAAEIMQMALSGRINLRSFLTHTIKLEDVPGMFGSIMNCDEGIVKCVVVF
ncbi:MAG: alcohol dehydrogenase catalytic domain-containing protein [Oscillospiraceae bacterium]|nr:alcohol dehydrogenase catalytic domain-containing protein [Oscillospiraceae bacterium]